MSPYDERLEHLLRQAARVFARKGYHATTMRELARATEMSLAGMYYYVRSKEELLFLVQERCFARVLEDARETLGPAADPIERLRAFVRHHVTFFAAHMDEMKVLSHEAESLSGPNARALRARKRAYAELLEELLADVLPEAAAEERTVTAYAIFGMMNWIYTWYRTDGAVGPEELADLLARLALSGVAAPVSATSRGA